MTMLSSASTDEANRIDSNETHCSTVGSGRPEYHVVAPRGWMNDPCAPGFDPITGRFHLFFQWGPNSHRWGDISWGHATSSDLGHWQYDEEPVLVPDTNYDSKGVFTGCFYPTLPNSNDGLTLFYTCVSRLPIHWSLSYTRGSEGLAIATSSDGGETWQKHPHNPILEGPPEGIKVTGFRDPFVARWPAMDHARGVNSGDRLYGLISGGIVNTGPRVFLYEVDARDLTQWTFLWPMVRVESNTRLGPIDLGINLECTSFLTLNAGGVTRQVLLTGTEGGVERKHASLYHARASDNTPSRIPRYAAWLAGTLKGNAGGVDLEIESSGMLDWGHFYAAAPFTLPDGRVVAWGWIIEEDLPDLLAAKKGWIGCLGVPRELFLLPGGSFGSAVLGVRPLQELSSLRGAAIRDDVGDSHQSVSASVAGAASAPLASEIELVADGPCTLAVREGNASRQGSRGEVRTLIVFTGDSIVVQRDESTFEEGTNTCEDRGDLRLDRGEALRMRVFLDHDVVEIFANDRFALSTRVYAPTNALGVHTTGDVKRLTIWPLVGRVPRKQDV